MTFTRFSADVDIVLCSFMRMTSSSFGNLNVVYLQKLLICGEEDECVEYLSSSGSFVFSAKSM